MKEPQSTDECVYYTRRSLGEGSVVAWAYKQDCPKCGKAKMGKPVEKGKVKIRAKAYVCPACQYTVEKEEHEGQLTAEAVYTCPHCKKKGETAALFKRKKTKIFDEETGKKVTVELLRFTCTSCGGNIDVTKKMK